MQTNFINKCPFSPVSTDMEYANSLFDMNKVLVLNVDEVCTLPINWVNHAAEANVKERITNLTTLVYVHQDIINIRRELIGHIVSGGARRRVQWWDKDGM